MTALAVALVILLIEGVIGLGLGFTLAVAIRVGAASETLEDARKTLWFAVALAAVMVAFAHLLAVVKP